MTVYVAGLNVMTYDYSLRLKNIGLYETEIKESIEV